MGIRAVQDLDDQRPFAELKIVDVFGRTGNFFPGVETRHAAADGARLRHCNAPAFRSAATFKMAFTIFS